MRGTIRRAFLGVAVIAFTVGSALLASAAPTPPKGPPGGPATDVACTGCVDTDDLGAGAVTDAKVTDVGADKITGTLAAANIPNLDASKIDAGTFDAARIPSLDASAIGTGTFDAARIPSLDASAITTGVFGASLIPNLDASIINAGTFDVARIPDLNASKINAGTLDAARIPDLNASKINAGTLDTARIPSLDAAKITTGTFPSDRLAAGSVTTPKQTANTATAGSSNSSVLADTVAAATATLQLEPVTHTVLVAAHAQLEFTDHGVASYYLERSVDAGATWQPTTMGTPYHLHGNFGQQVPISFTLADQAAGPEVRYRLAVSSVDAVATNGLLTLVDLGRT